MDADLLRELLDRERIRALSGAYALGVDKRDYGALRALFMPDARLAIYAGDPAPDALRFEVRGQDAIVQALRGIERYPVTSHVVGAQTVALAFRAALAAAEAALLELGRAPGPEPAAVVTRAVRGTVRAFPRRHVRLRPRRHR